MSDIVERLRTQATGAIEPEHSLMRQAADIIEFLRKHAGAISPGPSFLDIAKETPRRTSVDGGS